MNREIKLLSSVGIASCMALGSMSAASADEIRLTGANMFARSQVQLGVNLEDWAAKVTEATEGRVQFNIIHDGALLSAGDHLDGLSAGLADVTSFHPIYHPGEFRIEGGLTNIIDIWSEEVPDVAGVASIHAQLHQEFPEFMEEYLAYNIYPLVPLPAEPYVIACTNPVESLESLSGRTMRTFGRYFPLLQEGLGVNPITVPGPEAYQALSTGLVDCVFSTPDWIHSMSLHEVAPHLFIPETEIARPQLLSTAVITMNYDSFNRLPQEVKDAIHEVSHDMIRVVGATMQESYHNAIDRIIADSGGTKNFMTREELSEWADNVENQIDRVARDLEEAGLPGSAIIARYNELAAEQIASSAN